MKHDLTPAGKRLLLICLVGWLARLVVVALLYRGFLAPERDHWEFGYEMGHIARSLATGHGFSDPFWGPSGPTAMLTPVGPGLIAAFFLLFGVFTKASALAYLVCNTLLSALTAVPIYYIARRIFSAGTALAAAWTWAFFPNAINLSAGTMWYHGLAALELSLLVLIALQLAGVGSIGAPALEGDRLLLSAGFGVLFGFSALTTPVVLAILPFVFGWIVFHLSRQRKRVLLPLVVGSCCIAVTVLPWTLRNALVFHKAIPFKDNFWMELCVGNVGDGLHWWNGAQHPAGNLAEAASFARLGEQPYLAQKHAEALAYLHTHPGQYAVRCLRRFVFLWTGFWSFNPAYLHEEPLDPPNIFFLSTLSALAGAGLRRALREERRAAAVLCLLIFAAFPLPYYLSHLDPGYRHPLDPLLVILACYAVEGWLARRRGLTASALSKGELSLAG